MGFGKAIARKTSKFQKKVGHNVMKAAKKTLRAGETVGTVMRKVGEVEEMVGKGVGMVGVMTNNPGLAGAGAGMVAEGDMAQIGGMALRKSARGARTGDYSKLKKGGQKMVQVFN